jgi:hypothetical protein
LSTIRTAYSVHRSIAYFTKRFLLRRSRKAGGIFSKYEPARVLKGAADQEFQTQHVLVSVESRNYPFKSAINTATRTIRGAMTMREFKIGQHVYYVPRRTDGLYIVVRLQPQANGETRYLIRSQTEPELEFTVEATDLRRIQGGR